MLLDVAPDQSFKCVICDFGFASIIGHKPRNLVQGLDRPQNAGLTAAYSSPELYSRVFLGRATSSEYDKLVDVYAYGMTMFEVITQSYGWYAEKLASGDFLTSLAGRYP